MSDSQNPICLLFPDLAECQVTSTTAAPIHGNPMPPGHATRSLASVSSASSLPSIVSQTSTSSSASSSSVASTTSSSKSVAVSTSTSVSSSTTSSRFRTSSKASPTTAGIQFTAASTSSAAAGQEQADTSSSGSKSSAGGIIGGIVGALAIIAVLAALLWYIRKRGGFKRRSASSAGWDALLGADVPEGGRRTDGNNGSTVASRARSDTNASRSSIQPAYRTAEFGIPYQYEAPASPAIPFGTQPLARPPAMAETPVSMRHSIVSPASRGSSLPGAATAGPVYTNQFVQHPKEVLFQDQPTYNFVNSML